MLGSKHNTRNFRNKQNKNEKMFQMSKYGGFDVS